MDSDGVVSIGRNVGDHPMSERDWESFISDVKDAVHRAGGMVYGIARGKGEWEYIEEDTAFVLFADADRGMLTSGLAGVARSYAQKAAGLVIGKSILVPAPDG